MKVISLGGGPGGLYTAILMKKTYPSAEIRVYERNKPDDTFGWGVVFSDETLGNFEEADPETYRAITDNFIYWENIQNFYRDSCVTSTGHGFCGLSRKKLLQIFHERCRNLGVDLVFEKEITDFEEFRDADLLLGADGVNSLVRERYKETFQPDLKWGTCRFSWLGLDRQLEAFTFIFKENEHGLFQVHAYPFEEGRSTFIVECHEDTWKKAGMDQASEEETVAYMQELFADHLEGAPLLTNKSLWRAFPMIKNEKWHHENIVLLGDAAHTAHFSIGSGTKLAMEDAIALVDAFKEHGTKDVPRTLAAYQEARHVDVLKIQKTARTSQSWYENSRRYTEQHPVQFMFNMMTRSKAITYDNLQLRDPELVAQACDLFGERVGMEKDSSGKTPAPLFAPFQMRDLVLENRMVVSPMCQYSATDGVPNDWHLVHLGSRAIGGAGLVFTEATNVSAEGRITLGCTGMYTREQAVAWKKIVDFVHQNSRAKIGMQLGHAGRKGSCNLPWEGDDPLTGPEKWQTLGPSASSFAEGWPTPREMTRADMDQVIGEFIQAAQYAEQAGFDLLELHMAHGYLLSSFISPKSNLRSDEYGGSLADRMHFPLEVFEAVRNVWPKGKPLAVRISATDWLDEQGGLTIADSVQVARMLKRQGCDLIDVSSAGNTPESQVEYGRMYQVPFAEQIRYEAGIPVMAVGGIQGADHANTILAAGRANLCALARPHLVNPYITLGASVQYEHFDQHWPNQYLPAKPRKRKP